MKVYFVCYENGSQTDCCSSLHDAVSTAQRTGENGYIMLVTIGKINKEKILQLCEGRGYAEETKLLYNFADGKVTKVE